MKVLFLRVVEKGRYGTNLPLDKLSPPKEGHRWVQLLPFQS